MEGSYDDTPWNVWFNSVVKAEVCDTSNDVVEG